MVNLKNFNQSTLNKNQSMEYEKLLDAIADEVLMNTGRVETILKNRHWKCMMNT